ncbi:DNA helicase [Ranunculus cassubicifolius]
MQWPELFDLLDTGNNLANLSLMEKRKEKAKLLNDNPLITAWFLQPRVELFIKSFLKKEFSVVDYWYRYEWQNRGSGHVHGFLWIKDSPDVSQVATNEQQRLRICEYFDRLVCTMNPDATFSEPMQIHPCAKVIPVGADLRSDENDYISLVNWVERHSKCGTYCLRMNRRTKQMVCRFKYPMEILEQSKIIEEPPDSNMYRYMGRRNDELVNSHNRDVLQTWRANIDWSAILSREAVLYYVAKYAAKSEPASKNYNETLRGIIEDMRNPCQNSRSAVRRLLMKCVSERDISAQEVCHLIMGYALNRSSRKFVLLNLNENNMFSRSVRRRRDPNNQDNVVTKQSFFGRYLQRRMEFENVSLLTMAQMHYWSRGDWRNYKTHAVVRVIPDYDGHISPSSDKWEGFCRQQVLLHHHYRSMDDAIGGFQLWADQYNHLGLQQANTSTENIEDELEDSETDEADHYHEEWMEAAAQGPRSVPDITIDLGMRDMDITYDWGRGFTNYPNIDDDRKFVRNNLQSHEEENNDASYCPLLIDHNQLSPQQKGAHDLILNSLAQGSTIRLIVSGGAGTGKSTLINAIVSSATELFGNKKAVRVMAQTGVAAFNIGGSTIHHELGIYGELGVHHYKDLEGETLGRMQEEFKDTKLLIVDEYSMIGRKLLAHMDFRCRNIFFKDVWFGNLSVVLVGDIRQLPPVCDSTLYTEGGFYMQTRGRLSYLSFDKCIRLSQVFRQAGGEQAVFRDALLRLSDGKSTFEDWELFKTRDLAALNQNERAEFRYALRLFPTRKAADHYNIESLRALNKPVARIASVNNCQTATNADDDDAKGLQRVLLLSIGSRVMLRTNLATNYGLVNGARGIVEDIVYASGRKSPDDMPVAVMVNFDIYRGPKFRPNTNIIPIVPQTATWKSSETTCHRTQIPLVLCWAITVHKSQGLTLDKAVVDIGERESLGLTFVALSQTRKLSDLAFSPMFGFQRLDNIKNCRGLPVRRREEDRLEQLSNTTLSNK